jgi:hypothetical protein
MARARSTTGLHLLDAQTRVMLTGTPYHQDSLVWYTPADDGPPSQVLVELVPALLWSGDQAGWWGIEVRIDGYRVGELTHPEAGWYWPTVDRMLRSGRRPGAQAHVVLGETGLLEVELYLPVAVAPAADAPYPAAAPDAAPSRSGVPLWMGVAAAALAVVMIASVAADRINRFEPVTASPAVDTVLSLAAETPSGPPSPDPAPAPAPAVASSAAPVPVAAVQPQPRATQRRVVAKPKPKPKLAAKVAPKPKPRPVLKPVVVPEPTKPAKPAKPEKPKPDKPKTEKPKPEKPEKPKPEPDKPKPEKPEPDEPEKPEPKPDNPEKPGSDEPSGSGSSSPDDESPAGDD